MLYSNWTYPEKKNDMSGKKPDNNLVMTEPSKIDSVQNYLQYTQPPPSAPYYFPQQPPLPYVAQKPPPPPPQPQEETVVNPPYQTEQHLQPEQVYSSQACVIPNQNTINQYPVLNQPVMNQPVMNQPVMNQPVMNQPAMNQPTMNQPVVMSQPVPKREVTPSAFTRKQEQRNALREELAKCQAATNYLTEYLKSINSEPAVVTTASSQPQKHAYTSHIDLSHQSGRNITVDAIQRKSPANQVYVVNNAPMQTSAKQFSNVNSINIGQKRTYGLISPQQQQQLQINQQPMIISDNINVMPQMRTNMSQQPHRVLRVDSINQPEQSSNRDNQNMRPETCYVSLGEQQSGQVSVVNGNEVILLKSYPRTQNTITESIGTFQDDNQLQSSANPPQRYTTGQISNQITNVTNAQPQIITSNSQLIVGPNNRQLNDFQTYNPGYYQINQQSSSVQPSYIQNVNTQQGQQVMHTVLVPSNSQSMSSMQQHQQPNQTNPQMRGVHY